MKVWFRRFLITSLVLTFLVIMAGAIVRTTGSGMGCPDWPKCFGQYIPPTDISQLPADYKEIFKVEGKTIADFDAFKTWVEYINRLLGALLGLAALGAVVCSFRYWKSNKSLVGLAGLNLFLILLAAWLGAKVVYSNLAVSSITIHMLVSFAIITVVSLTILYERAVGVVNPVTTKIPSKIRNLFLLVIGLFVFQVLMGTQVREEVDNLVIATDNTERDRWIGLLPGIFFIHRSFSLVWTALLGYLFMHVFRYYRQNTGIYKPLLAAGVFTFLEILTGVIMAYFAIPPAVQPIHLLFSSLIFGLLVFSFVSMMLRTYSYKASSLTAK
ncbi:MAG: COX15/CtaA family protein [Sphingobacteriales bacterium JAD_PAG50586_3]|nr:MAG: COX15/CtaA family protein [Sphingobacteriales bacterium JAD_PAG50586_3]